MEENGEKEEEGEEDKGNRHPGLQSGVQALSTTAADEAEEAEAEEGEDELPGSGFCPL